MRIDALAREIGRLFEQSSRDQAVARRIVTVLLIGGGAALAGAAQFMTPLDAGESGLPRLLGYLGVGAAFTGAVWVALVDDDKSEVLEAARQAISAAQEVELTSIHREIATANLQDGQRRLTHLYQAMQFMREGVEQATAISPPDAITAVSRVLDLGASSIRSAIDFSMDEAWTISVYVAEDGMDGRVLRCVASTRFDQRAGGTRTWPIGVGHTGAAYARESEVVVPDLSDPALGTLDQVPPPLAHDTDVDRYRSIAAVPIRAALDGRSWGVVVATSDRAHRFTLDRDEPGSLSAEAVRGLAGMLALAVASQRRGSANAPQP